MSSILEGKKTYIGLITIALGYFGLGYVFQEGDVASLIDNVLQLVGLVMAIYGRYKAKPV